MRQGSIYSISISPKRGQLKNEVSQANIIENHGIENDGHAGDWHRQITCLDLASVKRVNQEHNLNAGPGEFAENILIEGLDLSTMTVGRRMKMGSSVVIEIAQIGKEDHPSIVTKTLGVSLLPYEGLFCQVVTGGVINKGDTVEII